ncbi:MAG TPA: hypothetical protein VJ739_06775 [Gemmataceae bacterium]|nr:hypothetical protein [Gemmataceae bacterium]
MTQWHPLFAKLLRPLVEGRYEVQTNVPVGDAPRVADILLLRRTSAAAAPFQGLWQWLTTWNVLEYKGPSVSARVADLDLLVELGLGIERRLNEEQTRQRQQTVPRGEMSFWYLANSLGRRFLQDTRDLLGELQAASPGVWRTRLLHRSLVLVSSRDLPVERDSVPLHLLGTEPLPNTPALAHLLGSQQDLLALYGSWILTTHPALMKELRRMGRAKKPPFTIDVTRLVDELGWEEVIRQLGIDHIVNEVGIDGLLAGLTPKQREELLRRAQETPPAGRGSGGRKG